MLHESLLAEWVKGYESARLRLLQSPHEVGRHVDLETCELGLSNLMRSQGAAFRLGVRVFWPDGRAVRHGTLEDRVPMPTEHQGWPILDLSPEGGWDVAGD